MGQTAAFVSSFCTSSLRRSTAELDAAGILTQRAAASALGPDTAAEATAVAEAVKAVADTAVTAAVAGK